MNNKDFEKLTAELVDEGKLIEAGWLALQISAIPAIAPKVQIDEMRMAFFAGAQHLFSSILTILEPGSEPTDADLKRMSLISDELDEFVKQFKRERLNESNER